MRFLIKRVYCLSAALCTVLWVNGKIFNVCALVFSKKTKKTKKIKKSNKTKKCMCALFFRYQAKVFAYTFTYYAYTSMLANEWSMI